MRYTILVLLNLPIVLLALINIVTQYKLHKISGARFRHQLVMWVVILIVLISSFPVYNTLAGKAPLDSHELSVFDIAQTTALVLLFYVINYQRQRLDQTERLVRDLHQEVSIRLSKNGRD